MKRCLASFLVAFFSFLLVSPALLTSDPESNLPACCRRNGAHRCSMLEMQGDASAGPALQSAPCSLFQYGAAMLTGSEEAAILPGHLKTPLVVTARILHLNSQSLSHRVFRDPALKRGPPLSVA